MKTSYKSFLTLAAAALMGISVSAQNFVRVEDQLAADKHETPENANRNSDNSFNRGSYLTNAWYDNWSFGAAVGIQGLWATEKNGIKTGFAVQPEFELNITKWITPTVAARFGWQGATLKEIREPMWVMDHYQPKHYSNTKGKEINAYSQMYLHFDLMLNLSNLIGGYKETRLVDVVPYLHAGYFRIGDPDYNYFNQKNKVRCTESGKTEKTDQPRRDREVAFGPGVLVNFRITDRWRITADVRDSFFSQRYHDQREGGFAMNPSLSVGATYTIKKWFWVRQRTATAPLEESYQEAKEALAEAEAVRDTLTKANDDLTKANDDLAKENEVLAAKVDSLSSNATPVEYLDNDELARRMAAAGHVIYYEINVDYPRGMELVRLEQYVRQTEAADSMHVYYLTGSADKGTGSEMTNVRLSHDRAENIKQILMQQYDITPGRIVIKRTVVSDEHEDGRLDRCVMLELE